MEYLIGAIVLGMLIWAGIEIVQTVRNWEPNQSEFNKKMQSEMGQYEANGFVADSAIDSGAKTVENALQASHCAAEAAGCEAAPSAIAHAVETLSHLLHH
ncbi:MAG: hypothetical protein JGK17_28970 [Microcoleus sp. PH2017_10_PVI_O_A]|uniref:hypothetical protein n=1 Tax=unclassified Microcoleus TaxID=2642155 RepID=UPI001E19EBDA|nr:MULTISPECIES: hypothetical protein [unclassified Microcoleus]TAE75414.1 MAG: hypothetical protein EAZ83_29295 [Oscillatoriales cyanobacterium]MCC3409515.1 hypothetical protein [Microcoleus sp. PH2017_10_PVI_O_A]MCC3463742.1 hypothetical protein [Microcoleus sp. PH2017_11_PCY_U_A]MCC3480404.1 hypothetical protein [Microcoleus sp. PH2017_12_PCY_D_A]MCC3532032.1 hypothetical protein [Microcoleus sp. PH2017_21_RUC_O_A]